MYSFGHHHHHHKKTYRAREKGRRMAKRKLIVGHADSKKYIYIKVLLQADEGFRSKLLNPVVSIGVDSVNALDTY